MSGVIIAAGDATQEKLADWSAAGHRAVVVVFDEKTDAAGQRAVAERVAAAKLDLYYWIEVARNPPLADAHPQWMASLGMHDDWQARFPKIAAPKPGQVAKAYPWVTIGYREAFDAQLARIKKLLAERAAGEYRGLLLNDLQGGPASCGCGNLLCRWATDYGVPSTGTKLAGDDVAARFIAEVRKLAPRKDVIPIWATECEQVDLPARLLAGKETTGLCGDVGCATGTCPKAFSKQWTALIAAERGPIGVLALHKELQRDGKRFAKPASWVGDAVRYLDETPPKHGGKTLGHQRLWIVVQGYEVSPDQREAAVKTATASGAGGVLVALTKLDQSYEPRVINGTAKR